MSALDRARLAHALWLFWHYPYPAPAMEYMQKMEGQ